jgi:hypothetical protein
MDEARQLYRDLASSMRDVLDTGAVPGLTSRTIGIVGVLWPSKKFADTHLVPGGAAAAASPIDASLILAQIQQLRELFPDPPAQRTLDSVTALVPQLPDRATARASFANQLRSLLDPKAAEQEDGSTELFTVSGGTLMDRLAVPVSLSPSHGTSGPAAALGPTARGGEATGGGAAGLGSLFGGVWGAALNLANFTTYYEMRTRAGDIGERGLAPLITQIHATRPELQLHLAGHSFGGRLVSAATNALRTTTPAALATLTLLQAAFSHYGFANDWNNNQPGPQPGHFRSVIIDKKVTGPTLITHTGNDRAVGIAYAIASRIAGQVAAAVGDANDIYGGIGRNGAQKTPEAVPAELLNITGNYHWQPQKLHNLLADKFIANHSDVTGQQVAYALLSAISTTQAP